MTEIARNVVAEAFRDALADALERREVELTRERLLSLVKMRLRGRVVVGQAGRLGGSVSGIVADRIKRYERSGRVVRFQKNGVPWLRLLEPSSLNDGERRPSGRISSKRAAGR